MQEGPRLTDFLNSLSEDPAAERLFEREPVAIMTKFGLTQDQQVLILEGSLGEIRTVIAAELGSDKNIFLMVICIKRL